MSSMLTVASNYQQAGAIPGYEADHQGPTTDQTGSVHEAISNLFPGEMGALGFLFDESPAATMQGSVATDLEQPAVPGITAALANRMRSAAEVTSQRIYQPEGNAATTSAPLVPATGADNTFSFTDTLRNEAAKLQVLVNRALGRSQGA